MAKFKLGSDECVYVETVEELQDFFDAVESNQVATVYTEVLPLYFYAGHDPFLSRPHYYSNDILRFGYRAVPWDRGGPTSYHSCYQNRVINGFYQYGPLVKYGCKICKRDMEGD